MPPQPPIYNPHTQPEQFLPPGTHIHITTPGEQQHTASVASTNVPADESASAASRGARRPPEPSAAPKHQPSGPPPKRIRATPSSSVRDPVPDDDEAVDEAADEEHGYAADEVVHACIL